MIINIQNWKVRSIRAGGGRPLVIRFRRCPHECGSPPLEAHHVQNILGPEWSKGGSRIPKATLFAGLTASGPCPCIRRASWICTHTNTLISVSKRLC